MLPNFLIAGAAKSGTTSLHAYLSQHPQVFMPQRKEPHYFAFHGLSQRPADRYSQTGTFITDRRAYEALFTPRDAQTAIGEASTSTLFSAQAAAAIRHEIPGARLIFILRQPADRAFSHYCHNVRTGIETCPSFAEALQLEPGRRAQGWWYWYLYRSAGYYAAFAREFTQRFEPHQLRFYLYDELMADSLAVVQDIYRFLGVDDTVVPADLTIHNEGGLPRSSALNQLMVQPNRLKAMMKTLLPAPLRKALVRRVGAINRHRPQLDPALRHSLTSGYREDLVSLQDMIGRDLSHWMTP